MIADTLNIVLIQSEVIFFNLWSLIHILSGFLIGKYLLKGKKHFITLIPLLILYEFIEISLIPSGLFRPEIMLDVIWDIIYGTIGWLVATQKK